MPDYRFSCSQAQQYAWIAEREPELFARITDKVAERASGSPSAGCGSSRT